MSNIQTKEAQKEEKEDSKKTEFKRINAKNRKNVKSTIKRSTLGFEVEFFIIDKNGKIVNEADRLLKKIKDKKGSQNLQIVPEAAENIIEVGSYPNTESLDTLKNLLDNLKILLYTADGEDLLVCPLGTYPGKYTPQIRRDDKYKVQEILFGKKRFKIAGHCTGYHFHYALPWGVFNIKKLTLKKLINSKNKQSLVNAYNFLISIDPAVTTFMQSSPFYQGQYLAKDSRMLVYRGGDELNYPNGLYANYQEFGALPSYEHTGTDIINLINRRYENWLRVLEQVGIKQSHLPKYRSILDTNWSPVKVNAHGTLEQRGMDMNHLILLLSVSYTIKTVLKAIQEDFINIECSDIAIKEPFKVDKKTIYIPPDTYVRKDLQKISAYQGLENDMLWYYCKRLLGLGKIYGDKKKRHLLEPLEKIIKDKKTISDEIISEAKKLGYQDSNKELPNEIASEIAINHSRRLYKEIVLSQKYIEESQIT